MLVKQLHTFKTGSLNSAIGLSVAAHLAALYFASQWTFHLAIDNAKLPPLRITEIIIEKQSEKSLDAPDTAMITDMANPTKIPNPAKILPREIIPAPAKSLDPAKPAESQIEIKPTVVAVAEIAAAPDPGRQPEAQAANLLDAIKAIDPAPIAPVVTVLAGENREPAIAAPVPILTASRTNAADFLAKELSIVPAPAPVISEIGSMSAPAPVVAASTHLRQTQPAAGAKTPHIVVPDFKSKPAAIIARARNLSSTLETFREIAPRQWGEIPADPVKEPIIAATPKNADGNAKSDNRPPASTLAALPSGNDNEESGGLTAQIKAGFVRLVRDKIAVTRQYPRIAQDRGYEGQPVVNFTLGREGDLLAVSIEQPSRHSLLDQAAIQTVKDAVPFPRIPEQLKSDKMMFTLPITFRLE